MLHNPREDSTASAYVAGPYDDASRILPELPLPRPVRLSFRGKSMLVVIPSIPVGVAGLIATEEHYHPTSLPFRAVLQTMSVVLIVSSVVMLLVYIRQKRLVSKGDLAIGRVTGMAGTTRIGRYLRYEFNTPRGERLSDLAWYDQPFLSAGMRLPVFYDPGNPDKKVALCGSLYNVIPTEVSREALV